MYNYTALEPGYIRLLHILPESTADNIQCKIEHFKPDIEKRNRFAALSYCWGNPTPVATITIDGRPLGVAQNLLDFLRNRFLHGEHMLSHGSDVLKDRGLWIDAICINQRDDAEKSEQVQRMWQIYTGADLVIAWLGEEKSYTKRAFLSLNTRYMEIMSRKPLPDVLKKLVDDGASDVVELSDNPYFSRTWMVQEILCAGDYLMLHSGRHVSPFSCLYDFSALRKGTIATQGPITARAKDGLNICAESLLYTAKRTRDALQCDMSTADGRYWAVHGFITTIMDRKNKQCSDPRDMVFAYRGLPTARNLENEYYPPLFDVDYSMTVDEVAVATLAYFGKLNDLAEADAGRGFLPEFIVIGLLKVDIASEKFREWLQKKMHRDDEHGIIDMITESGRRVDCRTSTLENLLNGEISPLGKMLTGRFEGREPAEVANAVSDERAPRDPKKYSAFPLFGKYDD